MFISVIDNYVQVGKLKQLLVLKYQIEYSTSVAIDLSVFKLSTVFQTTDTITTLSNLCFVLTIIVLQEKSFSTRITAFFKWRTLERQEKSPTKMSFSFTIFKRK